MTQAQMTTLAAALVKAMATMQAQPSKKASKPAKAPKPTKDEFLTALVKACEKRGYKDPQPNVNVLTYDRWLEKGRRVRKGEKSVVVNGRKSALFHIEQTQEEAKAS